jgi:hypothetical protein
MSNSSLGLPIQSRQLELELLELELELKLEVEVGKRVDTVLRLQCDAFESAVLVEDNREEPNRVWNMTARALSGVNRFIFLAAKAERRSPENLGWVEFAV